MNHINTAVPGGLLCFFCIMAGAPKGILSPEGDRRPAGGKGYGFAFLYPICLFVAFLPGREDGF